MLRRHTLFILICTACEPNIPQVPPTSSINTAVFNLTTAQIPQPNELSLQPSVLSTLPDNAQTELLTSFAAAGGFPSDQEVPVTVPFQRVNVDASDNVSIVAPQLDVGSVSPSTVVAIQIDAANKATLLPLQPATAADYAISGNYGTLTVHNKNDLPWTPGTQVIIAVRGGPMGVTVQNGGLVEPSPTFFLLLGDQNLSLPQNTTLLPGGPAQQQQEGLQLEALRMQYQPAFAAVDALAFPHSELAVMSTFTVAAEPSAYVETSATSAFPIPSNYLLDSTGHVQDIPAFGALAPGIATLDGFSTTAPITATTSAPILAATVTGSTVFLYDLTDPSKPVLVPDAVGSAGYVTEPSQVVQTVMGVAVSTVIALQPAVPIATAQGLTALPPLKENTLYAVVVTNGVKDLNEKPLSRSTLSNIVLFQDPLVSSAGDSELAGVDNGTAQGLEQMRLALQPVIAQAQVDKGVAPAQIASAYTFVTQTVTGKNSINDSSKPPGLLQLAALPYSNAAQSTAFVPTVPTSLTPVDAFGRFGVDTTLVPTTNIAEVLETTIPTLNLLSDTTGAFTASGQSTTEVIKVLIAVPLPAAVPACPTGAGFPAGALCAPLVVFHHGLGGFRGDVLTVANELTKAGFVAAAIDAPKHGDRSWCSSDSQCATGGTCVAIPGGATQGDATPPGTCSNGLLKEPMLCATTACLATWMAEGANQDGLAVASGNYLISGNLFRTRDTLRQDVVDNSALILALARPPTLPAPAQANPVTTHLAASGIVIDPGQVYWEGQSLGSILGTLNVAANPRIGRAALNVGGGTVVDVLTNAPAFTGSVSTLLTSLGIQPGTSEYFQFILLAKWVLDPAEPVNVAGNILGDATHPTLPDLLQMTASQTGKPVLAQLAACDDTVPNVFNLELDQLIGVGPTGTATSSLELFVNTTDAGGACPFGVATTSPGTVPHAFLTSWGVSLGATGTAAVDVNVGHLTLIAQDQNAAFLANPTQLPPPTQAQP